MAASDFLHEMAAGSRERVVAAKRACSEAALLERALALPPPPVLQPSPDGFDLIAELKLRSPAVGKLKSSDEDVAARVTTYAQAGAAAVSVLTEPSRFDGSMTHLHIAARSLASLRVPVMRKDFIVDPYQVIEARAAGAGGVLVILRMLSRTAAGELLHLARKLGLFVLLEAFDEQDLEDMHRVLEGENAGTQVGAQAGFDDAQAGLKGSKAGLGRQEMPLLLAGLNCRDLSTLQIVPRRLTELVHLLPDNVPRVAESGVVSAEDARRVAEVGYRFALVGSALMQGSDPHLLASAMLAAAREARGP